MRVLSDSTRRRLDARFAAIRSLDVAALVPEAQRHAKTIEAVRPGGLLGWDDEVWRVMAVHRYVEGSRWTWHELELLSLSTGRTTWMEWEKDDEIEITATVARLSLDELTDGEGAALDPAVLRQLVEREGFEQDKLGRCQLVWREVLTNYDDSGKAAFFRDCGEVSEPVWTAEFTAVGERFIALEIWEGGDLQAFLCEPVRPDAVHILAVGA